MKKIIVLVFTLSFVLSHSLKAQKDMQITMYNYAESIFNPAFTSSDRSWEATLLARQQWFNFNLAPETQFLTLEIPVKKSHGFGLDIMHDKLGYENNYDVTVNYAHYFQVGEQRRIGVGIGLNMLAKNLDGTQLIYEEAFDPNGIYSMETRYNFNLNAGLSYTSPHFSIGLSTRHIAAANLPETEIFAPARHYYLFSSFLFNVNSHLNIQPNALLKSNLQIWEWNAGAVAEFEHTLRFGFNYRMKESAALMLGLVFLKNFQVMYAYDIINGRLSNISPASHELVLRYSIRPKPPKAPYLKSPRYFN
ncbi:MAG: hypothetical protein CVU11_15735 [Bacteroidetes bacterium HGW-Bacteroidetes-6]|jgi:type IX secretion system PorP/SprF family membrane protein|nr:MAG: hypothetical protein CVU11_15735 [Bacteroidetes bacterium HGW-Bacteroidetes-6]